MAGLRVPLSTLRLRPYGRRRLTRGQDDWLGLSCTTLAYVTLCRFSTAHYASSETQGMRRGGRGLCGAREKARADVRGLIHDRWTTASSRFGLTVRAQSAGSTP